MRMPEALGVALARLSGTKTTVIAVGFGLAVVGWTVRRPPSPPPIIAGPVSTHLGETIVVGSQRVEGNRTAPVGIVEYADFQCPFSGEFARLARPVLRSKYVASGKVWWAFRYFPLTSLHPFAMKAARLADCADRENRFWEFHELLFARPELWAGGDFRPVIENAAVRRWRFDLCAAFSLGGAVTEDALSGERLGIRSTPTLLIGLSKESGLELHQAVVGLRSIDDVSRVIDQSLQAAELRIPAPKSLRRSH